MLTTNNPPIPDAIQLGHAKVVLDNSVASGSVSRDGKFVMCVPVVTLDDANDLLTAPIQPRRCRWNIHRLRSIPRSCL